MYVNEDLAYKILNKRVVFCWFLPSNRITIPSISRPLLCLPSSISRKTRQKKHANGTIYHFGLRHLMFFQFQDNKGWKWKEKDAFRQNL